ncbi:hypothetical protein ES708_22814 [subsurface metagenome]
MFLQYRTWDIDFFDYAKMKADGRIGIYHRRLNVDYEAKEVSFGKASVMSMGVYLPYGAGLEEPVPDLFDRAYMVGL